MSGAAHANEDASRRAYFVDVCHQSTAGRVKMTLKEDGKDLDAFCGCVSKQAVAKLSQPKDHIYALAYHEANIGIERKQRFKQPTQQIVANLQRRSIGYKANHGISFDDLADYLAVATRDTMQCERDTPTLFSSNLRGVFPPI